MRSVQLLSLSAAALLLPASALADGPAGEAAVTLETVQDPGPNRLDEPLAAGFSMERAVHFLDSASLVWQRDRKCLTCHTNYAYLYARPLVSAAAPAHAAVRRFAEDLVESRWPEHGPRWDAEVVSAAAALAFNDAVTTGTLHPATRTALDRMWTVQREDGGWSWLKCNWPPMESDDEYGACLAALAAAVAPQGYRDSAAARPGVEKLQRYLDATPMPTLHHEAMLLWAAASWDGLLTEARRREVAGKLLDLQQPDGGWSLAALGNWEREDGSEQDRGSDGYGTGFVVYVLRQAGVPSSDERIRRGTAWLKAHQRESGRWITRSLKKDSRHFISHCGTAFAVMALACCEE